MKLAALARRPRFRGAVALFLLLALVYSFSVGLRATRGASITGDEPFYLLTTQSLIQDGDLYLSQQYERESYRSFFDHPDGLWRQSVPTGDGRLLSPHEPGLSVLVIPGFALGGLRGAQVELLLIAALTFALAFILVSLETGSLGLSWLVTAAVGLSASAFVYSTEVYPELPAGLCLVLALLLLRRGAGGARAGIGLALLLSALAWLGMKYVPLAALVAVAFLVASDQRGRLVLLSLSAVSGALYVWFHLAVFDDLTAYSLNTVYEGADAVSVLQSHVEFRERAYRVWGLFIDQRFGIGRWAPLLLLLIPALAFLPRSGLVGHLTLVLICGQVLIATFVAITMMGWWFPGRPLVVVLPLFPLALTPLIAGLPAAGKLFAAGLGAVSLYVTVALQRAVAGAEVTLAVDPFDLDAPLFRALASLFPSYQQWSAETVVLTIGWLALLAVALGAVLRRAYGGEPGVASAAAAPRRLTLRVLGWRRG